MGWISSFFFFATTLDLIGLATTLGFRICALTIAFLGGRRSARFCVAILDLVTFFTVAFSFFIICLRIRNYGADGFEQYNTANYC